MSPDGRPGLLAWARVAAALARRPDLWATAVGQAQRLAAPGWGRRRPWLPLPPAGYLRFRLLTQYGDAEAVPVPADVVSYVAWCKAAQRASHRWQDGR